MRKALAKNTFVGFIDSKNSIAKEFESLSKLLYQRLELHGNSINHAQKIKRSSLKRVA
jgi:hypothetical protein